MKRSNAALKSSVEELYAALKATTHTVIMISNEVGSGLVPCYAFGRRFRDVVGKINQRLAAVADIVLLIVAGPPVPLNGSLEGGHR